MKHLRVYVRGESENMTLFADICGQLILLLCLLQQYPSRKLTTPVDARPLKYIHDHLLKRDDVCRCFATGSILGASIDIYTS